MDFGTKELDQLWIDFEQSRKAMRLREDYYSGNHPILGRAETYADGTRKSNRVANWAKYIINRYVGALCSTPYQVTVRDNDENPEAAQDGIAAYSEIAASQNLAATDAENLKHALLCGYGIEVLGYDSDLKTPTIAAYNPREWVLVKDTDGAIVLAFRRVTVQPGVIFDGTLVSEPMDLQTAYTDSAVYTYRRAHDAKTKEQAQWALVSEQQHFFGAVPLVEWTVTPDGSSILTDAVLGQIDEYNEIDSASGDEIRMDTDALLKISNISAKWAADNQKAVREMRVLAVPQDSEVEYLTKPSNLERVQSRLERTRQHIHMMGEVPDVGYLVGSTGATSGIALKLAFTPMFESAAGMIPYIKWGVRDRINLLNAVQAARNAPRIENYNVVVQFQIPTNRIEEWQAVGALTNIVSHQTQLELLTDVDDPANEMARIRNEQETKIASMEGPEQVAIRDAQVEAASGEVGDSIESVIAKLGDGLTDYLLKSGAVDRLMADKKKQAEAQPANG